MTAALLVILADDLTGATDAAVVFAKLGARTDVWLDRPRAVADAEVAAVDLATRALPPAAAAECLSRLLPTLPPGVRLVKKIDSTLRGNIAAETGALLAHRPASMAVVVPAHPRNGRVQRAGELLVDGTPVHESDFGRDLFTPVRSSDVRDHLPPLKTALVAAPSRLGEAGGLARELEAALRDGVRVVTIDAETEGDLEAIAAAIAGNERYLCIGSAGLLENLAPLLVQRVPTSDPVPTALVQHPVLFVIGSVSAMTHAQIATFAASGGITEMIDPRTILIDEGGSRSRAIALRIESALVGGNDILVALSSDRSDVQAALSMGRLHGFDVPTTGLELRERFVELVAPCVGRAGTIVLSGADVARTFLTTAGIEGIRLVGEVAGGTPIARATGSDMLVVTKAGSSGTAETYCEIARLARSARASSEAL